MKGKKTISLRNLEKQAQQSDKVIVSIESMMADSDQLIKDINASLDASEATFQERILMLSKEIEKEKEEARKSLENSRKEKEDAEKLFHRQNNDLKNSFQEETDKLEKSFKEREKNYRIRQAELEARLHDLTELRLKSRLKEQSWEKSKSEIQEKLKGLIDRINILLKEEKIDS